MVLTKLSHSVTVTNPQQFPPDQQKQKRDIHIDVTNVACMYANS